MKISTIIAHGYAVESLASINRFQLAIENMEANEQLAYAFNELDRAHKVSAALENISAIIAENPPDTNENKEVVTNVIVNELNDAGIEINGNDFENGTATERFAIASEGITGWVSRIWKAILEFLKKIKVFITRLFTSDKQTEAVEADAESIKTVAEGYEKEKKLLASGDTTAAEIRRERKKFVPGFKSAHVVDEAIISSKTKKPVKEEIAQLLLAGPTTPVPIEVAEKKLQDIRPVITGNIAELLQSSNGNKFTTGAAVIDAAHRSADLYIKNIRHFFDDFVGNIEKAVDNITNGNIEGIDFGSIIVTQDMMKRYIGSDIVFYSDQISYATIKTPTFRMRISITGLLDKDSFEATKKQYLEQSNFYSPRYSVAAERSSLNGNPELPPLLPNEMDAAANTVVHLLKVSKAFKTRAKDCDKLIDKMMLCAEKKLADNDEAKLQLHTFRMTVSSLETIGLRLAICAEQNALDTAKSVKKYMEMSAVLSDPLLLVG